jgi:hypothetical protein
MIRKLNFAFETLLVLGFSLALLFCARKERNSFVRDDYNPSQGWVKSSYDWFGWHKEGVNYMILPGTDRDHVANYFVKVSKAQSDQLETFRAKVGTHKVLTFETSGLYKLISSVVIESTKSDPPPHVKRYISSLDLLSSKTRDLSDEKGYYVGGNLSAKLALDKDANTSKLVFSDKSVQIEDAFSFAGVFVNNLAAGDYNVLLEYRLYGKTYFMPAKITDDAEALNTFELMNEEAKVLFVHGRFGSIQISYILPDLPVVEKEYSLPGDAVFNKSGGVSLRISQIESTPWADLLGFKGEDCDVVKLYINTQDGLVATDVQVSADGSFPLIIPADIAQTKNIQPGDKIVKAISCDNKRAINLVNITSNTTTAGIIIRPYQGSNGNGSLFQDAKIYDVKVDYTASQNLSGATFSPASKVYIEEFSDTQGRIQIEVPENTKVFLKYVLTASCVNKVVLSGSSVYSIGDNVPDCKDREYFEIKDQLKNITNASAIKVTAEDTQYTKTYDVNIKFIATITDVFEAKFEQQGNLSVQTDINRGTNEITVKNINRRTWETTPNGLNGNIYVSPDAKVFYQKSSVNYAFDSYILEPPGLVVKHQKTIPFLDKLSIEGKDINVLHESNILGGIPYKLHFEYLSQDTSLEELVVSQVVGTQTETFTATPDNSGNLIFTGLYRDKGVNLQSVSHKGVSSSLNAGTSFSANTTTATITITAEDGTERTYDIGFAYQDNEAYIEKLVLVQRGGGIPTGKVFSTEVNGPIPATLDINELSHEIKLRGDIKEAKAYFKQGSFYIEEIVIVGDNNTLSLTQGDELPGTSNLQATVVNDVLTFSSQDGLLHPKYKLIVTFMGTEADLTAVGIQQSNLPNDFTGVVPIATKTWNILNTSVVLNLGLDGVYKESGSIAIVGTPTISTGATFDSYVITPPNATNHDLIKVTSEDGLLIKTYGITPTYLSNCADMTEIKFMQSGLKTIYTPISNLPNRIIETDVVGNNITVKSNKKLIKNNGVLRISDLSLCSEKGNVIFNGSDALAGFIDEPKDNEYPDVIQVISEDKTRSKKYKLVADYLETEAIITDLTLTQQGTKNGVTFDRTFSSKGDVGTTLLQIDNFNAQIKLPWAYFQAGDIKVTALTASLGSEAKVLGNLYVSSPSPIIVSNPSANVPNAITITSEDKTMQRTYTLVFEKFLGSQAELIQMTLEQNFTENNVITGIPLSRKTWTNIAPDASNKLNLPGVVKNKGTIAGNVYKTSDLAFVAPGDNLAISTPNVAEYNIITVQSEDLLTRKTYKIAPTYLSDCTDLQSITLTQTSIPSHTGTNQLDINQVIELSPGNNFNVPSATKFVRGVGRFTITNPTLCDAGAQLYFAGKMLSSGASIDNPTGNLYDAILRVVSQDNANKTDYNLKDITYKNKGTQIDNITFLYTVGDVSTEKIFTSVVSNVLNIDALSQNIGTLTLKNANGNVGYNAVSANAQLELSTTPFVINIGTTVNYPNAFYVVSEDKTVSTPYNLVLDYFGEEASIKSLKITQAGGTLPNNMSLGDRNFSTDNNTIAIAGDQIILRYTCPPGVACSGVVRDRGNLVITDIAVEGNQNPKMDKGGVVTDIVNGTSILATNPNSEQDNSYGKIVVKSEGFAITKTYSLKLEFLGSTANIAAWTIKQKTPGNHAIPTQSINAKIWNVTSPVPAPGMISLPGAYKRAEISYDPTDLVLLDRAKVQSSSVFPVSNPIDSNYNNVITIVSEDGYRTQQYNLSVTYLSEDVSISGVSLTQTNVFNILDGSSLEKTITLTVGGLTAGAADLTIPTAPTNRFVSGSGQFAIAFTANSEATKPVSPLILPGTATNYLDCITVLSEDQRTQAKYSLKNIPYYNNGTTLTNVTFSYTGPVTKIITGTVNDATKTITLSDKLIKNRGTLKLTGSSVATGTGVANSLNATVSMSDKTIAEDINCLNCVQVLSESKTQTQNYTINYGYLSSDVDLKSISFLAGTTTFSVGNNNLVLEQPNTYVLKGVRQGSVIKINTMDVLTGNKVTITSTTTVIDPSNPASSTWSIGANTAQPVIQSITVTSEDGQFSKTYNFRIEYAIDVKTSSFAVAPYRDNRIGAGDFKDNPTLYSFDFFSGTYKADLQLGSLNSLDVAVTGNISSNIFTTQNYSNLLGGNDGNLQLDIVVKSNTGVVLARGTNPNIKKEQYKIRNWRDLQGMDYNISSTGNYTLEQDITFPGSGIDGFVNFKPIGRGVWNDGSNAFKGSLDGKYHKIINLYINGYPANGNSYVGLFSGMHDNASVKNIVFVNPKVYGNSYVGVLVGNAGVRDVYTPSISVSITNIGIIGGYVEANNLAGGLVGISRTNTSIESSFYIGTIKVNSSGKRLIGGFVGELQGYASIQNCFAYGQIEVVTSSSDLELGGFIGTNYIAAGTIQTFIESNFSLMNIKGLTPDLSTIEQNYNRVGFMYGYSAQAQIGAYSLYFSVPQNSDFSFNHADIPTMVLNSISPTVNANSTTNVATGAQTVASSGLKGARHIDVQYIKNKTNLTTAGFILPNVWVKDNLYMGGLPYLKWMTNNAGLTQSQVLQVTWK